MQTSNLLKPTPAFVQLWNTFVKHGFLSPALMPSLNRVRQVRFGAETSHLADRVSRSSAEIESEALFSQQRADREGVIGNVLHGERRGGMMGGYGGRSVAPPTSESMPEPATPQVGTPVQQKVAWVRLAGQGRRTLPVDLVPPPGAGPLVTFTGLGETALVISLASRTGQMGRWILGFILIAAVGTALARRTAKTKVILILIVLFVASLIALWLPATTDYANGAFTAGAALVLLYIFIALARCLWNSLFIRRTMIRSYRN